MFCECAKLVSRVTDVFKDQGELEGRRHNDEQRGKELKQPVINWRQFEGGSFGDSPPGIVPVTPYISHPAQSEQMAQTRRSSLEVSSGFITQSVWFPIASRWTQGKPHRRSQRKQRKLISKMFGTALLAVLGKNCGLAVQYVMWSDLS